MKNIFLSVVLILSVACVSYGQVPGSPVSCEIGIGGGATVPTGDLSNADNTGWNAGAKARFSGLIPLDIIASGNYNRLANKVGSESDILYGFGAGLEYTIPSPVVTPYIGAQAFVNVITNSAANATSVTREGAGIGAGARVEIPAFGHFDLSVQYQMLNLIGKETDEGTTSQLAATVYLMFNVF